MGGLAMRDVELALDFGRAVAAGDCDRDLAWLMGSVRSMFSAHDMVVFVDRICFRDEDDFVPPVVSMLPNVVHVPLDPGLDLLANRHDPIRAHRNRTGSTAALRLCDVVADPIAHLAQPYERAVLEHERLHYGVSLTYVLTFRVPTALRPAALSLFRDQEFTDRDAQLFEVVRPFVTAYVRDLARNHHGQHIDDQAGLTGREREILDHVAGGATNRQIAVALRVSPDTVRKHLERVYAKLEVSTRTAALARTGRALRSPPPRDPR